MGETEKVVPGPRARHLPGGNIFDDIRLDIDASIRDQDVWLAENSRRPVPSGTLLSNRMQLLLYRLLMRFKLWEVAVNSGLCRGWFEEFTHYWYGCLDGRPIDLWDFRVLFFHYRCRFQRETIPDFSTSDKHVRSWQRPGDLYSTLQMVSRAAREPMRSWRLPRLLRPGVRILEYGCGIAPMYRTWRRFFAHIPTQWVLADIPGFPFHYARHIHGADAGVQFVTITSERFADPLQGVEGQFDIIIIQEVFEHLDQPLRTAGYLLDRLAMGGLIHFDFVNSATVTGLDTPAGRDQRRETLRYLKSRLDIIEGDFSLADDIPSPVLGRKAR
jgi:2-polyprenyl-3-methyl-5-hydroxy-6-metoxy-1,4-benzoquinol methylase